MILWQIAIMVWSYEHAGAGIHMIQSLEMAVVPLVGVSLTVKTGIIRVSANKKVADVGYSIVQIRG